MYIIRITDARDIWSVLTNIQPGKIGVEYNIGDFYATTIRDSFDEADFHYFERKTKKPIPKGTKLKVECWWMNFYGSYFKLKYGENI